MGKVVVVLVGALVLAAFQAPFASAQLSCGYKDRPKCQEVDPPGQTLTLTPAENPYGLTPVASPSPTVPLYPRVRGHLPYGFNAQSTNDSRITYEEEADITALMGGSMTRIGVDWAAVQYSPTSWNYGPADAQYREAILRGIRPLLTVARAPRRFTEYHNACAGIDPLIGCLLPTDKVGCVAHEYCWTPPTGQGTLSTTVYRSGLEWWERFVKDVATRYPLAAGIEVWNEPNHPGFWGSPYDPNTGTYGNDEPNPDHYVALLQRARAGVTASGRNFAVIGGALANGGPGTKEILPYLRHMLLAGAANHMEALSLHPYPGGDPAVPAMVEESLIKDTRDVQQAYADAGVPVNERLIASETGLSTSFGYSESDQSWITRRRFDTYDDAEPQVPLSDRVDAVFFHDAYDVWEQGYGWVNARAGNGLFPTRPVYCDFREQYGGFSPPCPTYVP